MCDKLGYKNHYNLHMFAAFCKLLEEMVRQILREGGLQRCRPTGGSRTPTRALLLQALVTKTSQEHHASQNPGLGLIRMIKKRVGGKGE
uniref:Uncharacterized protein n=1 Tax=Physcomitrium patens TaxID=3218 RepID=A0A2K1KT10_PHYPA|nr:hypothetical protein PHYPA_003892 [Physcomitrium patens]